MKGRKGEERKSLLFDEGRESYRDMETGSHDDLPPSYKLMSPANKNKLGKKIRISWNKIYQTFTVSLYT